MVTLPKRYCLTKSPVFAGFITTTNTLMKSAMRWSCGPVTLRQSHHQDQRVLQRGRSQLRVPGPKSPAPILPRAYLRRGRDGEETHHQKKNSLANETRLRSDRPWTPSISGITIGQQVLHLSFQKPESTLTSTHPKPSTLQSFYAFLQNWFSNRENRRDRSGVRPGAGAVFSGSPFTG